MIDSASQYSTRTLSDRARAIWAKSGDEDGRLSLPQHMLDSACVAEWLWDTWVAPSVKDAICGLAGLSANDARRLYIWLAAVHDVGKAQLTFQCQLDSVPGKEGFVQELRNAGLPIQKSSLELTLRSLPHGLASNVLVMNWLTDPQEKLLAARLAKPLALIVDAHHGITSDPPLRGPVFAVLDRYPPEWKAVQREILEFAADISGVRAALPRVRAKLTGPTQNLLTGLVIMADWMASSAEAFPMSVQHSQADRAARAVERFQLTSPWTPPEPDVDLAHHMQSAFGWPAGRQPRPVQREVAEACRELDGPTLVVVEAPTGEGKTEAALTATEFLAHTTGAAGAIVAAPTMSTADGLFERVTDWARRSTAPGETTSMFLGHSKNTLNEAFRSMKYSPIMDDKSPSFAGTDTEGTVVASQWMSGRKKGILSSFTVATVDQILLMVLQSKHVMLRHLGLVSKVVVIDEVHAYDTYMSEYLQVALQWLARYGVPVVLLSATLPSAQKLELLTAYGEQLDVDVPDAVSSAYPLVTTVSRDGVEERAVEARSTDLHATVEIINDALEHLSDVLIEKLESGGCALIVCNTIRRAQAVYHEMDAAFPGEAVLHHAAFVASDRLEKEGELRRELGPTVHRGAGRPMRRIVVATQVAEQSLDIDADLLVSDIAPIDLLVQRIGRLHRHDRPDADRPENLRDPHVLIRGVKDWDSTPGFESGTEFIYDKKLLISTLSLLVSQVIEHGFRRPDDVASLVQSAYGDEPPIPEPWIGVWEEASTQSLADRASAQARASTFRFPQPHRATSLDAQFERQTSNVDTASGEALGLAQVRDSDPTIEVIPIIRTLIGYRLLPWLTDDTGELIADREPSRETAFRLASSTVRLPLRLSRYASVFDAVLDRLEPATPPGWRQSHLLAGQLALPLDDDLEIELEGLRLVYSKQLGLMDLTDSDATTSSTVTARA